MAYYSQQPQTNVIQVSGEQEVRSFQFAPNSTFAFFDRNDMEHLAQKINNAM